MSWVNDLASVAGVPGGAAVLAGAMYCACVAAEKAARPEALRDIGRILKDPSWSRSVRPSAIIERLFNWTFGERHWTWQCLERSASASMLMSVYLGAIYRLMAGAEFGPIMSLKMAVFGSSLPQNLQVLIPTPQKALLQICIGFVLMAVVPDFLALGKARLLIRSTKHNIGVDSMVLLVAADLGVSEFLCARRSSVSPTIGRPTVSNG